jgi:hypothetical protein
MIGYSVTLWYGTNHFKICHHLEGMHALIRYPPPVENEEAGDGSRWNFVTNCLWRATTTRSRIRPPKKESAPTAEP